MTPTVTFADVEKKYNSVAEHIGFCRNLALSDEFPAHATWLHPPTLARWLYGSICEFANEYVQMAGSFRDKIFHGTEEQCCSDDTVNLEIALFNCSKIRKMVERSRTKVIKKYPELQEVIV